MPKLHELLAVESDLEGTYKNILSETTNTFSKKPHLFLGAEKRLEMFDDKAEAQPVQRQEMTETVKGKLDYQSESIVRYLDAVLQKERTNQDAKANLEIDDLVIAEDIPATFLLGLETKLKHVRSVYMAIPTLPPNIKWEKDENIGEDVYRRVHPEETFKTAKTFKHKVLYEATDKHPAQIEKWEENVDVGRYTTASWNGFISPTEKSVLLGRIDKLLRAVKKARQRANTQEVAKDEIGSALFNYINGVIK